MTSQGSARRRALRRRGEDLGAVEGSTSFAVVLV
jgi:hypothetical protein